jgi:hypothetical protein
MAELKLGPPKRENLQAWEARVGFILCKTIRFLSFLGALRAEESLFSFDEIGERFPGRRMN